MRSTELTLPELALIGATRGMLGAGVGLLVADKLTPETRRAVGRTLFLIGLVSSTPARHAGIRQTPVTRRLDPRCARPGRRAAPPRSRHG